MSADNISSKIKGLLALNGKKSVELAKYLGISRQSLANKFSRGSFSAEDLIKVAEFLGGTLEIISPGGAVPLNESCIRSDRNDRIEYAEQLADFLELDKKQKEKLIEENKQR